MQLHPVQSLVNSCLLGIAAGVLGAYGLSGFVYGYLHFFVIDGFALLQGFPALMTSAGCVAAAAGWATHLLQRHGGLPATRASRFRRVAYWAWGLCWLAALVTELLMVFVWVRFGPPIALSPRAGWFLAPLPWVWPWFIGFAADKVVGRLLLMGIGSLLLGLFVASKLDWPRLGTVLMGLSICVLGAYFLGDASFQYAAARGLAGRISVGTGDFARALALDPGAYNAWTFVCWWGGWAFTAVGTLVIAGGLFTPLQSLRNAWQR